MDPMIARLQQYGKQLKLLYVEDDPVIRKQVHAFLLKFFPRVTLAENGVEGLEAFKKESPDMIISDIAMPELDGIAMIGEIKKQKPEQVTIVTSAYHDSDYLMKLINLGIDRFVTKPIIPKSFVEVLYHAARELHGERREATLMEEQRRNLLELEMLLDLIPYGVVVVNGDRLERANRGFLQMTGDPSFDLFRGRTGNLCQVIRAEEGCQETQQLSNSELAKLFWEKSKEGRKGCILSQEGNESPVWITCDKVPNQERYIFAFMPLKEVEDELIRSGRLIKTDPATGLPNRFAFEEELGKTLKLDHPVPVVAAGLANWSKIGKWHGKEAQEEAARSAGNALAQGLAGPLGQVFLAASGPNLFTLLCPPGTEGEAAALAKKLAELQSVHPTAGTNERAEIPFVPFVKTFRTEPEESVEAFLRRVDEYHDGLGE